MIKYKVKILKDGKWVNVWKFTRGKFAGWVKGGNFGFTYAVIQRKSDSLFVPRHDIHPDSLAGIEDK